MKKNILLLSLVVLGIGTTLTFTGCSKDDTTGPVVTITGATSIELSLNSGTWTDLGATATDDEDGTVIATSDASSTNPNTNAVGTYTITYLATDAAGNVGSAIRTIRVKNDAENFEGSYNVHDTVPGAVFTYTQTITADNTENNHVHFNRFGDYANNTGIYAIKQGNGTLQIPSQTAVDIGTGTGCNVSTHQFSSTSFTSTSNGFVLVYIDQITSSGCTATTTGTATYTRQ